jgi:hypothetical protein
MIFTQECAKCHAQDDIIQNQPNRVVKSISKCPSIDSRVGNVWCILNILSGGCCLRDWLEVSPLEKKVGLLESGIYLPDCFGIVQQDTNRKSEGLT